MESQHVNVVPSNNFNDSKVVEDVCVPSEISSIVEEPLVNPRVRIIDESHVSSVDISDVVNTSVESSIPMPDDITVPEDESSESIALYLPVAYDETLR